MEFKEWALLFILLTICIIIILTICIIIIIIWNHEKQKLKLQELQQALDAQDRLRVRTPQDHLNEYKSNPGHKFLTRSERRLRERLLEKSLKKTWSQDRSRSHSKGTEPVVKGHPAIKQFSRMNRQLRQPSLPKSYNWHELHLLFNQLCIYTALPFLTFCVLCHHLRINLTESLLLEESAEAELWELDPV